MVSTTSEGETDLREYIQNSWNYVVLVSDSGSEITRINIDTDDRASWSKDYTNNPVEATITVKGSQDDIVDPDATEGTIISKTQSVISDSSTTILSEDTDTDVVIEADNDEVIVTHRIEYPTTN